MGFAVSRVLDRRQSRGQVRIGRLTNKQKMALAVLSTRPQPERKAHVRVRQRLVRCMCYDRVVLIEIEDPPSKYSGIFVAQKPEVAGIGVYQEKVEIANGVRADQRPRE